MINYIISERSKLAQKKHKARHDWVGKMIHWELYKKLKFDHTTKWYMPKAESIQKNETHKILWDLEIQKGNRIPARKPIVKKKKRKKTCRIVDFTVSSDHNKN